jgi:hypothetical protein
VPVRMLRELQKRSGRHQLRVDRSLRCEDRCRSCAIAGDVHQRRGFRSGDRRVGSLEGGNALGRQLPQDQDRAAAIGDVAELPGADAESTRAIRWLIALMVLFFRALSIALTAAAGADRSIDQLNDVHRLLDRA